MHKYMIEANGLLKRSPKPQSKKDKNKGCLLYSVPQPMLVKKIKTNRLRQVKYCNIVE